MKLSRKLAYASAALALATAGTSAQALNIVFTNAGGVTTESEVWHGFNAAKYYWESVISDNVTINISVRFNTQGFAPTTLGSASSSSGLKTQTAWRNAIIADASTDVDDLYTANLPTFSATNVRLNTTVQKALGLYTGSATALDAQIAFNSARPFDFDTRDGFQEVASDFLSVAIHEIGHALGFTSAVAQNTGPNSTPTNTDLLRYKNGVWDMSWGGDPYLSIDGGATQIFGRSYMSAGPDGFQTSHWKEGARIHDGVSCTVLLEEQIGILDPTGGLCQEGIVTGQDLVVFDALGWDLNFDILSNPNYALSTSAIWDSYWASGVPEPATWGMMLIGFGMIGAAARSRPRYRHSAV